MHSGTGCRIGRYNLPCLCTSACERARLGAFPPLVYPWKSCVHGYQCLSLILQHAHTQFTFENHTLAQARAGVSMYSRHTHTHTPLLYSADEVVCAAQARTEAYLKLSNEICNMLISFLSFGGGIGRSEGLGLYYHTVWMEGRTGAWKEKGVMEGEEGAWAVYNPPICGENRHGGRQKDVDGDRCMGKEGRMKQVRSVTVEHPQKREEQRSQH